MLAMQVAPSFADNSYYVELGKDMGKDEAAAQWQALVAKNKSLFSHLQYFPKSVIQSGSVTGTRIQAGPITNKNKAQKICAKLFTQNIPCFVIEGIGNAPPTETMNLAEKAGKPGLLPWLTADPINPPPPVQETSSLPWLQDNSKRQGRVQVAEAIRVPLTDDFNPEGNGKVTVSPLSELHPTFKKQAAANNVDTTGGNGAGWLTVDTFPNEDVATSFWEETRATLPKSEKTLHVRVMKPLMAEQQSTASLAIGPFADSTQAAAFCDSIQAKDRGLNCHYDGSPATEKTQLAHGDAYNNRRMAEARKHLKENPLADISPAAGSSKQYWVQVVSASNQLEALHEWETLKSSNADLLGKMRSSVSASATNHDIFVVRVGPIAGNDDAVQLCTKLQSRSIDCRVLLYSVGL